MALSITAQQEALSSQSTFFTFTWTGLAKWSRSARWDVFHPWCSASSTEKCLKNATSHIYAPQSKMELGRTWLSAMPATSSSREAIHRQEHPGAVPSCAPCSSPQEEQRRLSLTCLVLRVNPRVLLQAPSPEQHAGQQENPYAQQDLFTVTPSPCQLWSKKFSI